MAKLRRDPLDAAFIDKALATEDDFNFELSCLSLLSTKSIDIEHGGTYSDPVTNLNRQFDFRIRFRRGDFDIAVAIECKNLKSFFPLIVSRVPRRESEAFHEILLPPENERLVGSISLQLNFHCHAIRVSGERSVYPAGVLVGKSTTQMGVKDSSPEIFADDSEAHGKWAQSIASAYGLLAEAASELRDREGISVAAYVVPALVVPDGTLWAADYSAAGERLGDCAQVDEIEFYLNHAPWRVGQMFTYTISHLHFLTQRGLISFVERLRTNDEFCSKIFRT
jgi:hypothetical protein